MKLVLNIVGMLIVLAICFLISYYRKSTTWTKTDQLIIQWIDSSYQLWK